MSEEEMKAVDYWKNYMEILHWNTQLASEHYMKVLLDLIEKQQIEPNSLKEIEYKYNKALEDLVKLEKERQADKEKINNVLRLIFQYGQIDGEHHKTWVIDQIVRILTENDYDKWVQHYEYDEETGEDYTWDTGIAP